MAESKDKPESTVEVPPTPSALALAAVGAAEEGESDEELNERAAKYAEAKKKARWG